ncbi:MAG: TorF family putative porin [Bauldia sp.]
MSAGLIAGSAEAADYSRGKAAAMPAPPSPSWDLLFTAAVTSDYVSRGITQTDHSPAVQGSVELDVGMFYAGIWASNVDFTAPSGATNHTELDLSVGLRPVFGDFTFDVGYLRYVYTDSSSNYGEVYGFVTWAINPAWSATQKVYVNPETSDAYFETGLAYSFGGGFKLSGAMGNTAWGDTPATDYISWNVGGSYTWANNVTLDLRLSGTNLSAAECAGNTGSPRACETRFYATLSYATAWSKLMGH